MPVLKEIETLQSQKLITFSFRLPFIDDQNSFDKSPGCSSSQSSTSSVKES